MLAGCYFGSIEHWKTGNWESIYLCVELHTNLGVGRGGERAKGDSNFGRRGFGKRGGEGEVGSCSTPPPLSLLSLLI